MMLVTNRLDTPLTIFGPPGEYILTINGTESRRLVIQEGRDHVTLEGFARLVTDHCDFTVTSVDGRRFSTACCYPHEVGK